MNLYASSLTDSSANFGKALRKGTRFAGWWVEKIPVESIRNIAHNNIDIPTAVAALLTFIISSKAIAKIPMMKTIGIR